MRSYLINKLNTSEYSKIVTLLDYEIKISNYLKAIRLSPNMNKPKLLIDTALCSGLNEYRFIEVIVKDDGLIDLNSFKYVEVSKEVLKIANNILSKEPIALSRSILTLPQKKIFNINFNQNLAY